MIRAHFGLTRNPFDTESIALLAHQQEIFDILRVHAQQGGLCLVLGEPGTGIMPTDGSCRVGFDFPSSLV